MTHSHAPPVSPSCWLSDQVPCAQPHDMGSGKSHQVRRLRAAFSLIEVLVAVSMITIGLFAGITAMGQSQTHSTRRQNVDIAIAAIQDKIEDFQAYSYAELFVNQVNGTTACRFGTGDTLYFEVARLPAPFIENGVAQSSPLKIQKLAAHL